MGDSLASLATLVSSPENEPSVRVTGSSYRHKLWDIDLDDSSLSGDVSHGLHDFWSSSAVKDSAPPSCTFMPLSITRIQWNGDSHFASLDKFLCELKLKCESFPHYFSSPSSSLLQEDALPRHTAESPFFVGSLNF